MKIWLVDLGLAEKIRSCFILSVPFEDEDRALVTVIAHTTSPRRSTFEVDLNVPFFRKGVFDAQNFATIPGAKFLRKLGLLSESQLSQIENTVRTWLGL